ncbi:MAG: malate dehydrogenase, partial [Gammaproteobacteria bacterium]|nr:malate dehydrogenase [Gammaproteobacteria bacterium]
DLVHDTTGTQGYSMARVSQGEYGIDEGLIFSVPCRTEKGHCKVIPGIDQNAFGQEKIARTLNELREEKQAVVDLELI